MDKKYCVECNKIIPESRLKQYKKRGVKTHNSFFTLYFWINFFIRKILKNRKKGY